VDSLVAIEVLKEVCHLVVTGVRGQLVVVRGHPGLLARLPLAADVDVGRRVVADQHSGQAGGDAGALHEVRHLAADLLTNSSGDGLAVDHLRPAHQRFLRGA
jgi:hypothetical protein